MTGLPQPLTPSDCDLRGYDWMRLLCQRLFTSGWYIAALKDSRGGIASLKLWWVAMTQCPAGSLPNDEDELCLLADFGQDRKTWKRHRSVAMRGFVLCSDNRYYHPVVAEEVLWAWERKQQMQHNRDSSAARMRRMRGRNNSTHPPHKPNGEFIPEPSDVTRNMGVTRSVTDASRDGGVARLVTSRALDSTQTGTEEEKDKKVSNYTHLLTTSPASARAVEACQAPPEGTYGDPAIQIAAQTIVEKLGRKFESSGKNPPGKPAERSALIQAAAVLRGPILPADDVLIEDEPLGAPPRRGPVDPQRTVVEQYAGVLGISLAEAASRLGVAA